MRRHVPAALAAFALGLGLTSLVTVPAQASADKKPPTLKLAAYAHYATGTTLDTNYDTSDPSDVELSDWDASFFITWTASDKSGICSQTLTEQSYENYGGNTDHVLGDNTETTALTASQRSYQYRVDGLDWQRLGDSFVVRATDCAGNTATSTIARTSFGFTEDNATAITYAGSWATSNFAGFSDGTTHWTSHNKDAATFTTDGGPVALVMEEAANRGAADLYIDGTRAATINTHSPTTQHRQVVWQALLPSGTHTLRLVNEATKGHPRIDLDAVLSPEGLNWPDLSR